MASHGWHRPYRIGKGTVVVATLGIAFGVVFIAFGCFAMTGVPQQRSLFLPAACVIAMGAIGIGCQVRLLLFGLWVSPTGVLVRTLFRTRTWRWDELLGLSFHRGSRRWATPSPSASAMDPLSGSAVSSPPTTTSVGPATPGS